MNVSMNALSVGLPGREKVNPDAMVIGPQVDQLAGKLGAIIGKQIVRRPTLPHQTVQNLNHKLAA